MTITENVENNGTEKIRLVTPTPEPNGLPCSSWVTIHKIRLLFFQTFNNFTKYMFWPNISSTRHSVITDFFLPYITPTRARFNIRIYKEPYIPRETAFMLKQGTVIHLRPSGFHANITLLSSALYEQTLNVTVMIQGIKSKLLYNDIRAYNNITIIIHHIQSY